MTAGAYLPSGFSSVVPRLPGHELALTSPEYLRIVTTKPL